MTENNLDFFPVTGIRLGTAAAGVSYPDREDLLVIELPVGATCAAVFTRNAFCAAPVLVAREHLRRDNPRYLLVNAGNANAGTGEQGIADAGACCEALARLVSCEIQQILPFSTGVIGEFLPVERLTGALPQATAELSENGWPKAARAIMTTDTRPKLESRRVSIDGEQVTVTGIAKGAGMIRPDMATLLVYVATDLALAPELLRECLMQAVEPSFNAITVDGDTSTNDACVLMASGTAALPIVSSAQSPAFSVLCNTVRQVCMDLARGVIRDGEGATKLVEVVVESAADREEGRSVAYAIAHSPLVKTALFASDPNWGRILAVVGRAGVPDLDINGVEIWMDDVCIVRDGVRALDYTEAAGQAVMDRAELAITVRLGRGTADTRVLTCDLSYDYVRINAEYRT
jgi:glutamate N-acetyltransferase/amino-acid N-acetyltransferase